MIGEGIRTAKKEACDLFEVIIPETVEEHD
jgi:hypothetical protein